jgi:hypothetical protein
MFLAVVAESEAVRHELPVTPGTYGIIALVVFGVLLAVTYAFRSVSKRH